MMRVLFTNSIVRCSFPVLDLALIDGSPPSKGSVKAWLSSCPLPSQMMITPVKQITCMNLNRYIF